MYTVLFTSVLEWNFHVQVKRTMHVLRYTPTLSAAADADADTDGDNVRS